MRRIRLIHWNAAEARERARILTSMGYATGSALPPVPGLLRAMRKSPPAAVVIDLSRLPSQGRDVALALRHHGATRFVPILFVEGDCEKVAGIRKILPDAVYTSWDNIEQVLPQAIAHPPADPIKPRSALEGYSGTPLIKKLGIKPGFRVALAGAPPDFETTVGPLPEGARYSAMRGRARVDRAAGGRPDGARLPPAAARPDLIIWFTRSRSELERGMKKMAAATRDGAIWIAWPKKTSPLAADHTEREVRAAGLAAGLVDFKVCAIDADWSGLKFTRRKTVRK